MLSRQIVYQRLRLFQTERVETLGEPAVDRSEQLASLIPLALVTRKPSYTGDMAPPEIWCTLDDPIVLCALQLIYDREERNRHSHRDSRTSADRRAYRLSWPDREDQVLPDNLRDAVTGGLGRRLGAM